MDINTSKPTVGAARFSPNRGQASYVSRQSAYYSTGDPKLTSSSVIPVAPTLSQVSEAAQRIVNPGIPIPVPTKTMNNVGSFDMLVPKKQVVHYPPQQNISPMPIAEAPNTPQQTATLTFQPAAPVPNFAVKPSLPTDLTELFVTEAHEPVYKKRGRLGINLPKPPVSKVLVGMSITLFVGGAIVSSMSLRTNQDVAAQVKSVTSSQTKTDDDGGMTSGVPDEQGNPPSVDYYRTASSYPRVLRISKLQIEARVLALAIAPTGALKAPANIFDAGWYKDSARPGEVGAMVIDGHASGPTKPGLFKNIGKLVKDDKIEVERGDGENITYTVQSVKVFDAEKLDMSSLMVPIMPGKPGLNIITAGGKFDEATQKYEQRTVVYAVII